MTDASVIWTPSESRRKNSRMAAFVAHINVAQNLNLPLHYAPLWQWSVANRGAFWSEVWDFFSVVGEKGSGRIDNPNAMPGARFFADGKLNFAENLLQNADDNAALIFFTENGMRTEMSRTQLRRRVQNFAEWLRKNGAAAGDSVCAYMPNTPETVIAFLGAASIGAVFSSCSMDFGPDAVTERFSQTSPKFLIAADGYFYNGRAICRRAEVAEVAARLPTLGGLIFTPFLEPESSAPAGATLWKAAAETESAFSGFVRGDFNAPLLALFSSGTTGAPKCIVHSAGGVLLQHLKELGLHSDIAAGAPVFYFTTCGWMMWNWLISALALNAAPVLYEGAPMYPSPAALWDLAAREKFALFGASAKYFDALRRAGTAPKKMHSLPSLKTICSTGSPLSPESFDYIYKKIKSDVQVASISGGTDIVSCFALGNPLDAVRCGELQGRGLGMAVAVYDENGRAMTDSPGELVCEKPFPVMPLRFYGDADGDKYRAAYFAHFPAIWRHGDWATLRPGGGMVIHGRSDATLNPGGVRIGTAEIYRPAESFAEIAEALAISQEWDGDTRVILFVRLAEGAAINDDLRARLREAIRRAASPRHVPAKIVQVADLPRTRSGKISEIAVRETVHNRPVKNMNALANPESLAYFRNLPALSDS